MKAAQAAAEEATRAAAEEAARQAEEQRRVAEEAAVRAQNLAAQRAQAEQARVGPTPEVLERIQKELAEVMALWHHVASLCKSSWYQRGKMIEAIICLELGLTQ